MYNSFTKCYSFELLAVKDSCKHCSGSPSMCPTVLPHCTVAQRWQFIQEQKPEYIQNSKTLEWKYLTEMILETSALSCWRRIEDSYSVFWLGWILYVNINICLGSSPHLLLHFYYNENNWPQKGFEEALWHEGKVPEFRLNLSGEHV